MKLLFTSLLVASLIAFSSFGQSGNIDAVIDALRSGNATELSGYFDDNVELTMPDKADSYSKAQAVLILKDFFIEPEEINIWFEKNVWRFKN